MMSKDSRLELQTLLMLLYLRLITETQPPDQAIGGFLRKHKIRGGARGFLATASFALLRRRIRLLVLWGHKWTDETLLPVQEALAAIGMWFLEDQQVGWEEAVSGCERILNNADARLGEMGLRVGDEFIDVKVKPFLLSLRNGGLVASLPEDKRRAAEFSIVPDILRRWWDYLGEREAGNLARAMTSRAPLDVRVNVAHSTRDEVLKLLGDEGHEVRPTEWSPDGIRFERKAALAHLEVMKNGWIEVQDEGSQLVGHAVAPKEGWRILDACAGGGGKTVHLAALLHGSGRVYAHDIDAGRLEAVNRRAEQARLANIEITTDPGIGAPYDAVLIDAPCLGLGRLRRDPTLNWHGELSERLAAILPLQRECLLSYASMVKPGGIVVYATCSIEPEETTQMMDWFLRECPSFTPDPLPDVLEGIPGLVDNWWVRLLPSVHGTDGFFIARLRRSN